MPLSELVFGLKTVQNRVFKMANRDFHNGIFSNQENVTVLWSKITAAADVEANGYTVTSGGAYISTVARTGEGAARITLVDPFLEVLAVSMLSTRSSSEMILVADSVTSKIIDVVFEQHDGTATDPDSAVMRIGLWLRNSTELHT
jgi:hypothetical protein